MPEHTSFFSYLLEKFPALAHNLEGMKLSRFIAAFQGKTEHANGHQLEPLLASAFVVLLVAILAFVAKQKIQNYKDSVIPDEKLTLKTFLEVFVGVFYTMCKDVMGPERAKKYFPFVGTCAVFVFFSNVMGMIPGFLPPTSTWNITLGCAICVFLMFNFWGLKENGMGYVKHLAGPMPALAPLIFPLELLSLFIRPVTLSIRLMMNMAVDHLLLSIALGISMLFVPIPIMILGTLVVLVQTYVFSLLTSIYIALATEHEDHGPAHGHGEHGHGDEHAKSAH